MKTTNISVLIVDDEAIIRQGLRNTLDWEALGFTICGEAGTGEEAIEKTNKLHPDLILLDIRMPRMYGTELMEKLRNDNYDGEFIVLSGYSDFEYAQKALKFGADCYLTKPIDEDELKNAVLALRDKIRKKKSDRTSLIQYASKAKRSILHELLTSDTYDPRIDYKQLGLSSYLYQVVIYESYTPYYNTYSFADILRVANKDESAFEHMVLNNQNIIVLKGEFAIDKFNRCLEHYRSGIEKGSPLDILFLTYGPTFTSLEELHRSYEICTQLMSRRFFCTENQHILSWEELPDADASDIELSPSLVQFYSRAFVSYIQAFNRRQISDLLEELSRTLYVCGKDVNAIKYFMIDIFLQIKGAILNAYPAAEIPFVHNAAIIELLTNKYYLYEIIAYFSEQFEMIMRAIGNNSSNSVLDDILYYIEHNYEKSIELKTLAKLFGYNSSYLGKMFKDKIGQSFNSYLDSVRIKHAAHLLTSTDMKIYEISAKVGYKNVDYFQQKFKKIMETTPSEYRSAN